MERPWWKEAVIYEIYCKSFCDSNGDGIGDLPGVLSKLPMLKELGIDCIWFTPIYTSPMVDNGYDVADYQNIDPDYGTLEDFRKVLQEAHKLGIRVIMDMVLNHSSDEHFWFQESRKSKDNPYRNYYIWQPPRTDGSPPNNWGNYFREGNGSAWEFDERTGEYYLHQYSIKMPDLNWEYEPLRQEIYRMLRWWADMGVDGFRLDVFSRMKKPAGFPDSKKTPDLLLDRNGFVVDKGICTCVEGIHEILQELHRNVFGPCGSFTVGEGAGIHTGNAAEYVAPDRGELDTVYHFELASRMGGPFSAEKFRSIQSRWEALRKQGCWPTQYLCNHDQPRAVSRYGDDGKYRVESAKLLATMFHTVPGTPFIYQGEEFGMVNVAFDSIEDYNCCYTVGDYHSMVQNGASPEEALRELRPQSRDNARSPYVWNDSPHGGFTTGTPWMKVNPNYRSINLAADRNSADSVFAYYQALIGLRRTHPAILDGNLKFLLDEHPQMLVWLRRCEAETLLVIANYSGETVPFALPREITGQNWARLLTNRPETTPSAQTQRPWLPWEAEIYVQTSGKRTVD